jgi:prepilin signal peptidase PulO-like enzyme (type II secretory pathway)
MTELWVFAAFVIGAIMGSFICCQVRRVIVSEKLHGFAKFKQERSRCEHCHKHLKWWEMIPVLSWLFLQGKCRNCNARIGLAEIMAELGLGAVFAISTLLFLQNTPFLEEVTVLGALSFGLFLLLSCGLFAVFIFDLLTGEMPTRLLTFCIICAILFTGLEWAAAFTRDSFMLGAPLLMLASVAVLSGFYFVLSVMPSRKEQRSLAKGSALPTERRENRRLSRNRLVGDGDWLVALPLAIVLAHPMLAIANLFLANIIGAIIAIPFMVARRWSATTRIPFAPLLIVAFFIIFFARDLIFEMFMVI